MQGDFYNARSGDRAYIIFVGRVPLPGGLKFLCIKLGG